MKAWPQQVIEKSGEGSIITEANEKECFKRE